MFLLLALHTLTDKDLPILAPHPVSRCWSSSLSSDLALAHYSLSLPQDHWILAISGPVDLQHIARMYLVYRAKGFGVWLIPAALGMAFTLLVIPWTAVRSIWCNLRKGQGLDIQRETPEEREQNLRGPGPRTKKNRLYPNISWADRLDKDIEAMTETPYKKTIVGVLLREMSPFLRSSAPQISTASGSGQAPSRGCEAD